MLWSGLCPYITYLKGAFEHINIENARYKFIAIIIIISTWDDWWSGQWLNLRLGDQEFQSWLVHLHSVPEQSRLHSQCLFSSGLLLLIWEQRIVEDNMEKYFNFAVPFSTQVRKSGPPNWGGGGSGVGTFTSTPSQGRGSNNTPGRFTSQEPMISANLFSL